MRLVKLGELEMANCIDALKRPLATAAKGFGIMLPAKRLHQLLGRCILKALEIMDAGLAAFLDLSGRQMRCEYELRVDLERIAQPGAGHGCTQTGVCQGNSCGTNDTQVIETLHELAAAPGAAAPLDHLAGKACQAQLIGRIVATPGGKQPRKGSRLNPVHGLGKQHKAVFKTVNVNVITQLEDSRKRGDVELNVRQERVRCSSGKGDLGCLEDGFDDLKAKSLVQPQGTAILGSDLERGTGQAVLAKSIQGTD